ncbi:hypothetical protein D3C73_1331770 [compost metagenome]
MFRRNAYAIVFQDHVQNIRFLKNPHFDMALPVLKTVEKYIFQQRLQYHARNQAVFKLGLNLQPEGKSILIAVTLNLDEMLGDVELLL